MAPPIRKADGTVIEPQGIQQVRKGDGTVLFNASEIPDSDLVHHYDATEFSLSDGDFISTWTDEQGSADLTPGTSPTYIASAINNKPVARFDGSDDYLNTAYTSLTEPNEIFAVFQILTQDGTVDIMIDGRSNGEHQIGYKGPEWYIFQGAQATGGSADTNPHIADGIYRSGTDELLIDSTPTISSDVGNSASTGLTVGTRGDAVGNFMNVDIGEIAVYQTELPSSQRSDVESYLADKWDITL